MALDGMDIEPARLPEPFGGRNYLATVFVHAPVDIIPLASSLRGLLTENPAPSLDASASAPSGNSCVVRVLAERCSDLYRVLNACRGMIREHLRLPAQPREVS